MNAMNTRYILGGAAAIAILAFAYYAISPLFRNVKVDEALPSAPAQTQEENGMEGSKNEPIVSTGAEVVGTLAHPASGIARLVQDGGKTYLRYENFKTINGPDLFVYLSTDKNASEFVNLGALKATEGNINYEIPAGTDLSKYPYALVWCRAFGVLFNSADLSAI